MEPNARRSEPTVAPETAATAEPSGAPPDADSSPDEGSSPPPTTTGPWRCAADPSVETYLRCGSCERPICPRCLIQTPVGARCRACARLRRLPMFEVGPRDYLRGIGAGLGAGYGGGLVLTLVQAMVPFFGFLGLLLMLGFGYVVGEAVSRATRSKRGNGLGAVAAIAVPLGLIAARATLFIVGGVPPSVAFAGAAASVFGSLWAFLGVLVAAGLAYSRVR